MKIDPKYLPIRLFFAFLVAVACWRLMSSDNLVGGFADLAFGALVISALLVWQPSKARSHRLCLSCTYDPRGIPADTPCPEYGSPPRRSFP